MIAKKDIFNAADFSYESIDGIVDKVVKNGISTRGAAKIVFNNKYGVGEFFFCESFPNVCEVCVGYLNELIYQCHKAGFQHKVERGEWSEPKALLIYIE